ncbi:MAG: PilZ domain-containing protein [Candidatus Eisenbacteria sp.]|nr:PilZ domain-containing protein [Candidatus Eisenbacteria bacterium]
MIEKLDKARVMRVLPEGTPVIVATGGELTASAVTGMLSSWSGSVCCICLSPDGGSRVPPEGSQVKIVASRLDGVYHIPGVVESVHVTRTSELTPPDCKLFICAALERGTRVQRRAFFRVSGDWRIEIDIDVESDDTNDTNEEDRHPCRVWNLSAGGMLLEDGQRQLRPGMIFSAHLDLADGGEPVELQMEAIRRDDRFPEAACAWGCRVISPSRESEKRILYFLHERLRTRFLMKPGASPSGNSEGDAQSA